MSAAIYRLFKLSPWRYHDDRERWERRHRRGLSTLGGHMAGIETTAGIDHDGAGSHAPYPLPRPKPGGK